MKYHDRKEGVNGEGWMRWVIRSTQCSRPELEQSTAPADYQFRMTQKATCSEQPDKGSKLVDKTRPDETERAGFALLAYW